MAEQFGEYRTRGDYHKDHTGRWVYLPVYLEKMAFIRRFMRRYPKDKKILDLGCGEGVLVEELAAEGRDIIGLDLNYEKGAVRKGSILSTPFEARSFDLVLCLDVIEHLTFEEQEAALKEIDRILKDDGLLIASIPNLAHFMSRIAFLVTGTFIRTSSVDRHKGDRPIAEYTAMLRKFFTIRARKGLFPTFPLISLVTYLAPEKALFLHKIENLLFAYPGWCFLNIFVCEKKRSR